MADEKKKQQGKQGQINIELDENVAQGTYSNLAKRFENAHGEIKDYQQPPMPINFGPTGQA